MNVRSKVRALSEKIAKVENHIRKRQPLVVDCIDEDDMDAQREQHRDYDGRVYLVLETHTGAAS